MKKPVTIEQFTNEVRKNIDKFEKAYKEKHENNPENYPLELKHDNSGLWLEFFIEFYTNGTV